MDMDNNQLQILDIVGIPTNKLLYSSYNDTLVYSIGSNIIFYNLQKNTKTFLQYSTKNEILALKYIDQKEHLLLSIDKSSRPILCIWELPSFEEVFSQEIQITPNFKISNIFVEKISSNYFVIIITSIDCNLLYILNDENNNSFNLVKIGQIPNIPIEIENFKCFYDDIYLIFISNNNLYYFLINIQNIFNSYKKDTIRLFNKIVFPFKLIGSSMSISNRYNLISFITSKGNCLVYNKNGESRPSINPLDKYENFTISHFSGDSLCLGTDTSKIYIYNVNNFKLKYFIKDKILNSLKLKFQLNSNVNINNKPRNIAGENKVIEYINLNEKLDKIFIKMNDNSILLSPLTSLMDDSRGLFNFNSLGNTICLYSYNHSKPINSMEICNNYNEYETMFYTCSKDQTLIQYNIDYSTNKISNIYFDLKDILNFNKENLDNYNELPENNNSNSNKYSKSNYSHNYHAYLTVIKFHPFHSTKLYAGDNKGYLYVFDISTDYFQYKKYTIDNYSIESLSFSREGNLLCIGLLTGKQVIYDINKNLEFCLKISENYLKQDEIDFRIQNYHMITFSYFFNSQKHRDCIIFAKNSKNIEYAKLFYDDNKGGMLNKKSLTLNEFDNTILDIKVHASENYIVALNDKHQIIINDINTGETTAVIDLNGHVDEIYNFDLDRSGLYLCVVCSINKRNNANNDLIFFETGTGNIISMIRCVGMIYRIIFDYYGKYIIMAGHKGEVSLWKLPYEMSNVIVNVLYEVERNVDFWEKFEIKYHSNNDINKFDNFNVEDKKELKKEMPIKDLGEVVDEGPHKGIQTNFDINTNNGDNRDRTNPSTSLKVLSDISNDLKKDNNSNNNNNDNFSFDSKKYFINNRKENMQLEINKTIPMKSNNNDIKNNSGKAFTDFSNKDNVNYYFNSQSKDLNKIKNFNNNNNNNNNNYFSNSISNTKSNTIANANFSSSPFDNFNNNLKNENTLQSCYEKFKKERLMKNSLLKPNVKSKDKNKKSYNLFNAKSQNVKNKKLNSLSTPKILNSKKYLKENSQSIHNMQNMYKKYDMNSRLKFNKKKDDDINIDFELDFDANKMRPNFDPNLYSMQTNKKYSQNAKELIQPLLADDERKFSRYNTYENGNGNQFLSEDFNGRNNVNNLNRNIGSNNFNNLVLNEDLNSIKNLNENLRSNNHINNIINKEKSIINSSKKSHKNSDKANEINKAINVLLDNKNKGDINNGYDNNNNNSNIISSKDISHDLAYINNVKMDQKSNIDNLDNMNNNLRSYENENKVYDTENKNKYLNFYSKDLEINDNNQKSVELDKNLIASNTLSSGKPDYFINNRKPSINNNIPIDENILFNNKYRETISTEKRNYINDKINSFENKLNYYGQ